MTLIEKIIGQMGTYLADYYSRESRPTSRLTLDKPRSGKRRNPRLFLTCPNTLSGSCMHCTVTGKNVAVCATISADSFAYALKCCTKCNIPAPQDRFGVEMLQKMQHFTSTGPFYRPNLALNATFARSDPLTSGTNPWHEQDSALNVLRVFRCRDFG